MLLLLLLGRSGRIVHNNALKGEVFSKYFCSVLVGGARGGSQIMNSYHMIMTTLSIPIVIGELEYYCF